MSFQTALHWSTKVVPSFLKGGNPYIVFTNSLLSTLSLMKEASGDFLLIKKGSAFIFPLNLNLFYSKQKEKDEHS